MAFAKLRRFAAPAWVRPEALNVTPELLGAPLAPLDRRALAMAIDLLVIGALSRTGEFWVAAGIGALFYQLRRPVTRTRKRALWMWLALGLLVLVGVQRGAAFVERQFAPPQTAAAKAAADDDDDDDARAATLAKAAAASDAATAQAAAQAALVLHDAQATARIRQLEAELAEARKPQPVRWHDQVVKALRAAGRGFGWAIAYFTLLTTWWKGQTLGKRLLRLRVVELTGKPLGLMNCFGRYGGYAAAMATGGTGFAQVLWDPNRQAMQDKLAHTVVIDLRGPHLPAAAPAQVLEDGTVIDVAPVRGEEAHPMIETSETWLARVRGRVQGVGYREACVHAARTHGVTGWVRNRVDGSVEALLQGTPAQLAAMRDWLQRGPPAARVEDVAIGPAPATQAIDRFERRETE